MSNQRPTTLDRFIGQPSIVAEMRTLLGGAKYREESAPHMLFMGPPGLGKTTLAQLVASEMGTKMVPTLGNNLKKEGDLAALILNLEEGDVLFIDEIHAMPRKVSEILYTAIEDFHMDIVMGSGAHAQAIRVDLPRFTLVGATTHPGAIPAPLRDRFGFTAKLEFYGAEDLQRIVTAAADTKGVEISDQASGQIADASRGTPRIALRLLARAIDYAQTNNLPYDGRIYASDVTGTLEMSGTAEDGLTQLDLEVLTTIFKAQRPLGLSTIAATLGEEESTLSEIVEPFLLRLGLIERLPNGRWITFGGLDRIKKARR